MSWCNLGMRHNIAMFGIIIPEGSRTNRLIKVDKHLKYCQEEGSQRDMLSQCFYFPFLISFESFFFQKSKCARFSSLGVINSDESLTSG